MLFDSNLILRVRNELGWMIVPCSCRSGYAWQKPLGGGGWEMVGCISKVDLSKYLEPTPVQLRRMDALKLLNPRIQAKPVVASNVLDDIIHDRFGQQAAGVNNGGIDEQLQYLFDECDIIAEVDRMLGYLEEVLQ